MVNVPPSTPQCVYCGLFHAPDYSDVRGTVQEWIETVCGNAKQDAVKLRRRAGLPDRERSPLGSRENPIQAPVLVLPEPKAPELQVVAVPGVAEVAAFERQVREMAQPSVLHVKFMRIHGHAGTPVQAYRGDAGHDLELCEDYTLKPGEWQNLRTGIVAAIPAGFWGHILARSSTWRKLGIRIEPAVIDSSYRGELMVYAVNTKKESQEVKMGQRLAQIIVVPLPNVEWLEQGRLPPGEREERGYGSSGS